MSRIPLLNENDPATPPEMAAELNRVKQTRGGQLINLYRAMANHL